MDIRGIVFEDEVRWNWLISCADLGSDISDTDCSGYEFLMSLSC
jgi:hypothetical protein